MAVGKTRMRQAFKNRASGEKLLKFTECERGDRGMAGPTAET